MSVVRVFLCLLLVALAACDGDRPAAPEAPREAPRDTAEAPAVVLPPPPSAPPVEPAPAEEPAKVPPAVATPPAAPAAVAPRPSRPEVATRVEKPAPLAPLDLSLPDELLERLPGEDSLQAAVEPQPLLPPLFGDKAQQPQSFELGGRLITDEDPAVADDEDSWHELQGAELELRFRR